MKNLVIVESPAKCKTIEKYLGSDYKVVSSKGHIRDLATTGKFGLGLDIENDFKPNYEIIKGKKKEVTELKKEHVGQIQVYMNYIDKNIKTIEENDTVGVIICKQDNEYVIKYCSDASIIAREYELV